MGAGSDEGGFETIVGEDGSVTIPGAFCTRLGVRPGDFLELWEEKGRLVMIKHVSADPADHPPDRFVEILREA